MHGLVCLVLLYNEIKDGDPSQRLHNIHSW